MKIDRKTLVTHCHLLLWLGLSAGFLWSTRTIPKRMLTGCDTVVPNASAAGIGTRDSYHTTDYYLRFYTGSLGASQVLTTAFDGTAPQHPLVVITKGSQTSSVFLGMLMAYLSWPHPVQTLKLDKPKSAFELAQIQPSIVSGLVFCDVDPPASLGPGVPLGRNSTIFMRRGQQAAK
ncbi:MAG: hypothetical protein M3R59_06610 [Verrucomicrobiota bacterium]|nr:hypothetical protein [Verrucomicrobiota bacterium]